jgi:hypothetical protein
MAERWTDRLVLRLDGPASPARVVVATRLLADAALAAVDRLDDGELTLVVSNYQGRAELRAWTPRASDVLDAIARVLRDPDEALEQDPASAIIAEAIAQRARDFGDERPAFTEGNKRKPFVEVSPPLVENLERAVVKARQGIGAFRGTTSVYSNVLRVGRLSEGGALRGRVTVRGKNHDLRIADGADSHKFFEAAEARRVARIRLDAQWLRRDDGSFRLDPSGSTLLGIDTSWVEMSGAAFVAKARERMPDLGAHLDEILSELDD